MDKEWALLTAGSKDNYNTMTVSWGGFGTLWSKPVVTVYVKPIRYTFNYLENNDYFTLSFYDESFKKDLGVLGSKSGRDLDKIVLTNLEPEFIDKSISFKQALITIVCKKIYSQDLDIENIPREAIEQSYKIEQVHRMYIGEVVKIIDKR